MLIFEEKKKLGVSEETFGTSVSPIDSMQLGTMS